MAINVEQIDTGQGGLVLHIGEGHFCDVKSIDIRPARLTETISAFANADGVNRNQGAESTLSWILSLLIMHEMHPGQPQDQDGRID